MTGNNGEMVETPKYIKITGGFSGLTVLEVVRRAMPQIAARAVFKKARMGRVLVNARKCKPLDRVAEDDLVTVILLRRPIPQKLEVTASDKWVNTPAGPFTVVREDAELLVVSKPPGCASHPALGHGGDTLIERIIHYLGPLPDEFKPALANRLDLRTSGLVFVGKTPKARQHLGNALQKGRIDKYYLTLVAGWTQDEGEIDRALEKRPDSRDLANYPEGHPRLKPRMQQAHTRFRTVYRAEHPLMASLLDVELVTGRYHQIRRHLSEEGFPVAQDQRYGDKGFNMDIEHALGLERIFLHCYLVRLKHPTTDEPLEIFAKLPDDLADTLRSLGGDLESLGQYSLSTRKD